MDPTKLELVLEGLNRDPGLQLYPAVLTGLMTAAVEDIRQGNNG